MAANMLDHLADELSEMSREMKGMQAAINDIRLEGQKRTDVLDRIIKQNDALNEWKDKYTPALNIIHAWNRFVVWFGIITGGALLAAVVTTMWQTLWPHIARAFGGGR